VGVLEELESNLPPPPLKKQAACEAVGLEKTTREVDHILSRIEQKVLTI
jgi:hypothetical protein